MASGERWIRRRVAWVCTLAGVGVSAVGAGSGCGGLSGVERGGPAKLMMEAGELVERLEPVGVRVHPLTRVEQGGEGRAEVVCHLELSDRAGDSVKWPMAVRVEVRRMSVSAGEGAGASRDGGEGSAAGQSQRQWEIDLTNEEAGEGAYDRVSRTYVVRVGPVEGAGREGTGGGQREWLVRVWVTLPAVGTAGGARLADEARVRG